MILPGLCLAWIAGLFMSAAWDAPPWIPGAVAILASPAATHRFGRTGFVVAVACGMVAVAGAARLDTGLPTGHRDLASLAGQEIDVTGKVLALPEPGITTSRVRVEVVEGAPAGQILLTVSQYADYLPGDQLRVRGTLEEPPKIGDFDYRAYLDRRGIAGTMFFPDVEHQPEGDGGVLRAVARLRRAMQRSLERALPEPEASLAAGITLGRDGGIPASLYDDYRDAGLAHVIAVSGANVAILTSIVFLLVLPVVGRNIAVAPAIVVAGGYVLLAGADGAVVRGGIMAGVMLVGFWLGRPQESLTALAFAVVIMTALWPRMALDVGFQLSAAATAGIIVFSGWFESLLASAAHRWRFGAIAPRATWMVVAVTLSAWVATAPVIAGTFGRMSLISPLANLIVEPVFAIAFALSLAVGAVGLVSDPAAWILSLVAYFPLAFCNGAAAFFASVPGAAVDSPALTPTQVAAIYVALAIPGGLAWRYLPPDFETRPLAEEMKLHRRGIGFGLAGATLTWALLTGLASPGTGDNGLRVDFLDVGQGDAALLTTPSGKQVLVDTGPSGIVLARELAAVMPYWDRSIDMLIISHPEQDHLAGAPAVLDRYRIKERYDNGFRRNTEVWRLFDSHGRHMTLRAGDSFELDGVRFEIAWPIQDFGGAGWNNRSLVMFVDYAGRRLLFTGDIESEAQEALLTAIPLEADVLKVPHHGSASGTSAFVDAVDAELAVISVGGDNPYGHPRQEALDSLSDAIVFRTDLHGRVTVTVGDNGRIRVTTER